MKRLSLISFFCAGALAGALAHAQYIGVYLSTSFDQASGSAYAYAETTGDYSLGYYHTVCASADAFVEDDSGAENHYSSPPSNCDASDAQMSWNFTVPLTTVDIEFTGDHTEEIDYPVYDYDENCGFDGFICGDYWDAYGSSLLGVGGQTYDEPGSQWDMPGYPVGYGEAVLYIYTYGERGTWCWYPDDESSSYIGPGGWTRGGQKTGARFSATLDNFGGIADYTGRTVGESLNDAFPDYQSGGCWFPDSDYPQVLGVNSASTWTVSGNSYSTDFIGADSAVANYYQYLLTHSNPMTPLYVSIT